MTTRIYRIHNADADQMARLCGAFGIAYVPGPGPDYFIESDVSLGQLQQYIPAIVELKKPTRKRSIVERLKNIVRPA